MAIFPNGSAAEVVAWLARSRQQSLMRVWEREPARPKRGSHWDRKLTPELERGNLPLDKSTMPRYRRIFCTG
jgi:hypothetical protein